MSEDNMTLIDLKEILSSIPYKFLEYKVNIKIMPRDMMFDIDRIDFNNKDKEISFVFHD